MNWILASTLMFIFSILFYLVLRKNTLLGISTPLNNLALMLVPFFLFVVMGLIRNIDFRLSFNQLIIITISSILFSYLGNVLSLKSIEYAPNPGYSLILSKSYVVLTTIVSVILFGSSLTLQAAFAILLIVTSSPLIMIDKTAQKKSNIRASWLPMAIGAFFCFGLLSLSYKYLQIINVDSLPRLIYVTGIVSLIIILEIIWKKTPIKTLHPSHIFLLILSGMLSAGFNYFMQEGINTSPNIGYVNAFNASSIAALSVFSALIFKDELTKKKLFGVLGVTTGLILLVL